MRTSLFTTAMVFAIASNANASGPLPPVVDCDTLPSPVYIQCGDTQQNLMLNLGRALSDNSTPITLVWVTAPSCTNINLTYVGGKIGDGSNGANVTTMSYAPSSTVDATWQTTDGAATCNLPAGGVAPNVTNSALYNSACNPPAQPATVYLAGSPASQTGQNQTGGLGPKQAYVLAVPRGTTAVGMTAEEAYFLFGFGPTMLAAMSASLAPWTDAMQVFIRKNGTSTLLAWGANIQIPGSKFQGIQESGSPQVVAALEGSTNPGAAIGMIGAEVYDTLRASLQVLAFRAFHQYAAYFPDSTETSRDKKNLRDGHYTVWSPTVWMDFTDGTPTSDYPQGTPLNQTARFVIDIINNQDVTLTGIAPPDFDTQQIVAEVGLVPDCAMKVQRSFEGGPLSLYQVAAPAAGGPGSCTCKYEATVDVSTCATCDTNTPCATGVCREGYCEEY